MTSRRRHPDLYIGNAGVSTEKALQATINGGIAKAGLIAIPLTILILAARARLADRRRWCRCASRSPPCFASIGPHRLAEPLVPMDAQVNEVILLVGLAVGVDYSLFYMRRERDERRAGRLRRRRSRPPPPPPAGPS